MSSDSAEKILQNKRKKSHLRAKQVLESVLICSVFWGAGILSASPVRESPQTLTINRPNNPKDVLVKISKSFPEEEQKEFKKFLPKQIYFFIDDNLFADFDWKAENGKYSMYLPSSFFCRDVKKQTKILNKGLHEITDFRKECISYIQMQIKAKDIIIPENLSKKQACSLLNKCLHDRENHQLCFLDENTHQRPTSSIYPSNRNRNSSTKENKNITIRIAGFGPSTRSVVSSDGKGSYSMVIRLEMIVPENYGRE